MVARGEYVDDVTQPASAAEIAFWTEWEAVSTVERLSYAGRRPSGAPEFLHRPVFPDAAQRPRGIPQNTDPFVFGGRFLYTFCGQSRASARKIHDLGRGSVIVFGSVRANEYVCDTVFVVDDLITHTRSDWREKLGGAVPEVFVLTTLEPMYAWRRPETRAFTLYIGASARDPVDGMFSFVPCKPWRDGSEGFARVSLNGLAGITPKNARAIAFSKAVPPDHVQAAWLGLSERVLAAGLSLGTRAELEVTDVLAA